MMSDDQRLILQLLEEEQASFSWTMIAAILNTPKHQLIELRDILKRLVDCIEENMKK